MLCCSPSLGMCVIPLQLLSPSFNSVQSPRDFWERYQWSCVFVVCYAKWNSGIWSNVVPLSFVLNLGNPRVWALKSWNRPMGNIPYQEPKFFAGTNHFWKAENTLKMNHAQGGLQLQKPKKTSNVWDLVRSDHRLTIRMMSDQLNLSSFTVHQILTEDLHMRKVCAKMVPKNLTTE